MCRMVSICSGCHSCKSWLVVFVPVQELEGTRAACAEGDALLQETEGRVAAAQTAAVSAQEQAVQVRLQATRPLTRFLYHAIILWQRQVVHCLYCCPRQVFGALHSYF